MTPKGIFGQWSGPLCLPRYLPVLDLLRLYSNTGPDLGARSFLGDSLSYGNKGLVYRYFLFVFLLLLTVPNGHKRKKEFITLGESGS